MCFIWLCDNILYFEDFLGSEVVFDDFFVCFDVVVEELKLGVGGVIFMLWFYGECCFIFDYNVWVVFINFLFWIMCVDMV